MTKTGKKTILGILLALVAAACCMFTACTDGPAADGGTAYTVTVKTDADTPAAGVKVTIKKGSAFFESKVTDANGKVAFSLAADSYEVALADLPAHYGLPEGVALTLTAENPDLTVTLVRAFAYEVKLVNPDNTPFYAEGTLVGVCTLSGTCLTPVALGENGVALIEADKSDYHVKITDLPASYAYECDKDGYYTGKNFSATETTMTITVYPVVAAGAVAPMTDAEKEAFLAVPHYGFRTDLPAYKLTQEIAAGGKGYFAVTPSVSGKYVFYTDATSYFFLGTAFTSDDVDDMLGQYHILEADKTYYIAAKNIGTEKADAALVVSAPVSSYIEYGGVGGTVNVTVGNKSANAIVAVKPASAGAFKVTAQGETLVEGSRYEPSDTLDADPTYVKDSSAVATVLQGEVAYFAVTAKTDTYPAEVSVQIERIANADDVYSVAAVKETLVKYAKPQDKELHGVALDGSAELVYNSTDKFYHLGSADGETVVVQITEPLDTDRFAEGCELAYMDLKNSRLATYLTTYTPKGKEYTSTINYTVFLRGFEHYDEIPGKHGNTLKIPETIATEHYYAKYVNEDGVYPLTEELKVFLENFYAANEDSFFFQIPEDADLACGWMFPLYYYGEAEEPDSGEDDAIVGEYKDGGNTLTVNANGKFVIASAMGNTNGTWEKSGNGTYTFIENNPTFGNVTYNVEFDEQAGTLKFYDVDMENELTYTFTSGDEEEDEDAIVGEYKDGDNTLTVNANGTFEIASDMGSTNGTWGKNDDGTYTFIEDNPTFGNVTYNVEFDEQAGTLKFYDVDMENELTYTFTSGDEEEPEPSEIDVVIGEYELVSFYDPNEEKTYQVGDELDDAPVTADSKHVTVTVEEWSLQEFSLEFNDLMPFLVGPWSKNADGTYAFTDVSWGEEFAETYTVTYDSQEGTVTFEKDETVMYVFKKVA